MNAATTAEWLTAAAIGTALYVPGALLILGLDHDLTPRMPRVDLTPALEAADRAAQWTRVQLAALLLLAAWHLETKEPAR